MILAAALAAFVAAPVAEAATRTIVIRSTGLSARDVTITAGDTVVWRNADTRNHQIVSTTGVFSSPVLRPGQRFSFTFVNPGTYRYRDALNPTAASLRGVVRVRPAPVVALAASQGQIVFGTKVMLTGQISSRAAGEQIQIVHQPHGQMSPVVLATVVTGSEGTFGLEVRPTILTTYQAIWRDVTSAVATVAVAPRVTLGRASRWVSCVFAGRSMRGEKVRVQRRSRFGEWVTIKSVRLGPKSCGRFTLALPRGVSRLRVALSMNAAGPGYLAGLSREVAWRRR